MTPTEALSFAVLDHGKRMAADRGSLTATALEHIDSVVEQAAGGDCEGAHQALWKIGHIARTAMEMFQQMSEVRPGAGKRVKILFERRAQGFALALGAMPAEYDAVDKRQVEHAFSAVSDWLALVQGKRRDLRGRQDEAKSVLGEALRMTLPGYQIDIAEKD